MAGRLVIIRYCTRRGMKDSRWFLGSEWVSLYRSIPCIYTCNRHSSPLRCHVDLDVRDNINIYTVPRYVRWNRKTFPFRFLKGLSEREERARTLFFFFIFFFYHFFKGGVCVHRQLHPDSLALLASAAAPLAQYIPVVHGYTRSVSPSPRPV